MASTLVRVKCWQRWAEAVVAATLLLVMCRSGLSFAPHGLAKSPPHHLERAAHVRRRGWRHRGSCSNVETMSGVENREQEVDVIEVAPLARATFVKAAAAAAASALMMATSSVRPSQAEDVAAPGDKFVNFVDSRGLFSCRIPAGFLRSERGKDKKGTVFVAGDYNKAEVLSVQVLTTYDLLTDAGVPTIGDLTKWEALGKPRFVAELLKQRRDSDASGGAQVESVVLPGAKVDGDVLQFMLKSPIKVMRTDLLEKDQGVNELYRTTYVKAIMRGDGSFLVVWAGALNTDWDQEGGAKGRLDEAVQSFRLEGLVVDGVRLGTV